MELLLLDKNFQICGLIDDFSSLVWNRKYYEVGNFSIQLSKKYLSQFENAKYIYSKDFEETGIIEAFNDKSTAQSNVIQYSGRFLESILERRVIDTTQKFTKKTSEEIIRSLVNTFIINAEDERKIPGIILGELKGLGSERTMQITGGSLLDKIYNICKEDELSINLKYDFDNNQMIFNVWQGLNRLDTQSDNTWAIFSKDFENILEDEYSIDNTKYHNYAYVEGETNESSDSSSTSSTSKKRVEVIVDRVKAGEERIELYVDARDLQKDEDTTDDEYKEMLKERGIEKLNENNKVETVTFEIDTNSNLIYEKDYDLGDKVIYKNSDLNLTIENRIIEISEAYENGEKKIDIVFGEDYNIKKLKELI